MPPSYPQKLGPFEVHGTREIHRTPWLRVREDQITRPNGERGEWTVVEMRAAVGVVALDSENRVHLVGQHRYAVDRYEWEVPAGFIDAGETPLAAAKRELREEAGLAAKKWTALSATHPHNGSTDSIYYFFLAQDLTQIGAAPEADEQLSHKLVDFRNLLEMVQSGEILDAMTVIAVYRAWFYSSPL